MVDQLEPSSNETEETVDGAVRERVAHLTVNESVAEAATMTVEEVVTPTTVTSVESQATNEVPIPATVTATANNDATIDNADASAISLPDSTKGDTAAEDTAGYSADQSMHASRRVHITNHKKDAAAAANVSKIMTTTEEMTEHAADQVMAKQQQQETTVEEAYAAEESKQQNASAVFVNVGLVYWEKNRVEWLGVYDRPNTGVTAKAVDVDEIIDVIFQSPRQWREKGGPSRFPTNVPLPQMVDILQDLWEAEGLDT